VARERAGSTAVAAPREEALRVGGGRQRGEEDEAFVGYDSWKEVLQCDSVM
jgi:hypothetical protein